MTAATMTAAAIGKIPLTPPNTGLSAAAAELTTRLGRLMISLREPLSLGGSYAEALRSLSEVAEETAQPNWNGYGSAAIQREAVHRARKLLASLPTNFPAPEIAVDPDGEVAFEWYCSPDWVLSVSIGGSGSIVYAGRFGKNERVRGAELGQTDELSPEILGHLARLVAFWGR